MAQYPLIGGAAPLETVKFLLEHALPRKVRYAKVYFEAGGASIFFSLDGASANWYASVGRKGKGGIEMSDKEYARLRAAHPAVEELDSDGPVVIIRNADGYEEEWVRPQWVLAGVRKTRTDAASKRKD